MEIFILCFSFSNLHFLCISLSINSVSLLFYYRKNGSYPTKCLFSGLSFSLEERLAKKQPGREGGMVDRPGFATCQGSS